MNAAIAEWQKYRDLIYPKGISGVQERECRQSFLAGMAIMMDQMTALSALPEDQAMTKIAAIHADVERALKDRLAEVSQKRN